MRLVYAELLKIRTAPRTTLVLVLVLLGLVGLGAAGTSYDADHGRVFDPEADIIDVGGTATIFALLLGILIVTWEYRHGTITQTLLAEPRRERVVVAKVLVAAVLGVMLAILALVLSVAIAEIWLGDGFQLAAENWGHMGRLLVACALWSVLGLGLGATMQSQVGALISALVWFLVAELVLAGLGSRIGNVGDYLPGQVLVDFGSAGAPERFTRATAGLLSAAYAFALAAVGTVSVLRRDVP